jgi:hypothetical protein
MLIFSDDIFFSQEVQGSARASAFAFNALKNCRVLRNITTEIHGEDRSENEFVIKSRSVTEAR